MELRFQDLDNFARAVVFVVGLISVLAPLTNLIVTSLKDFQFGRPKLFAAMAVVASLGTFLCVFNYRNSLHHFPQFWTLLIVFVIAVIVLLALDAVNRRSAPGSVRAIVLSIFGLPVYVLAASLLSGSLTIFSAQYLTFKRVYGVVTDTEGKRLKEVSVFCINRENATIETATNSDGKYQFLLTKREACTARVLRAGQNRNQDDNFVFVKWNDESFPHKVDFKWQD